jgi:hypothetical protein
MNSFWNWLTQGQINIPTLKGQAKIAGHAIQDTLSITAGNKTVQPGISRETVFRYVDEYLDNPNERIVGQKRYVIALYKAFEITQG